MPADEPMADPPPPPGGGGAPAGAQERVTPAAAQEPPPAQQQQPQAAAPPPPPAEDGGAERSGSRSDRRAEVYTIEFESLVYSLAWSVRPDKPFRLAVGTFKEDTSNTVEIMQLDEEAGAFRRDSALRFSHPYPPTKLLFCPDADTSRPDLLASTGDHLRVWRVEAGGVTLDRLLTNNKSSEFCAPLTSFDWNDHDPKRLGTSSIDTTCTIWDIERGVVDTQLIAHDREVYDIAWGGVAIFATVSADGSVRVFDLRDKEHSTIIYESPRPDTPLLRLSWNKQDPRYMATFPMESTEVIVLDIRYPTVPIAELSRHHGFVNALSWAPHSSCHLCTVGDDAQALIWDLSSMGQQPVAPWQPNGGGGEGGAGLDPILSYSAGSDINQLQWSVAHPDWIAINYGATTEVLRV